MSIYTLITNTSSAGKKRVSMGKFEKKIHTKTDADMMCICSNTGKVILEKEQYDPFA